MSTVDKVGALEVGQDLPFERRWWCVQRVAWGALAVVVAGALAGACGRGPLSRTHAASPHLRVDYSRVERLLFSSRLRVALDVPEGAHTLAVRGGYPTCMQIARTYPIADDEVADPTGLTYRFRIGGPHAVLELETKPQTVGFCRGLLVLDGGEAVALTQVVLP